LRRRQQQQQGFGPDQQQPQGKGLAEAERLLNAAAAAAAGSSEEADATVQLPQQQQHQHQQQLLLSEEQEAMVCQMGAAQGELDFHGRCGWEYQGEVQGEDDEGEDLDADSASGEEESGSSSSSSSSDRKHSRETASGKDHTAAAAEDSADAPTLDDHAVPDISYSYCPLPTGIVAPYTLPQAVAFRIVNEAYNRMSMDNLAVAVLDVREAAAAAANMRRQQQQQSSCAAQSGSSAGSVSVGTVSKSQGLIVSSSSSSNGVYGKGTDQAGSDKFTGEFTAEELEALEFLQLPHCELQAPEGAAAAAAVTDSAAAAASQQGRRVPTPASDRKSSSSSSSSSDMTALQRLLPTMQWGGGSGSAAPLSPSLAEGSALMCGAPDSKQPSHHHHHQQQQQAGTAGDRAGELLGVHQYVLVQRMADAATAEAGHCHLHPVLGVDEVQLEDGEDATVDKGGSDEEQHGQHPQQQQHSLSR
jgi:hypothetical protein